MLSASFAPSASFHFSLFMSFHGLKAVAIQFSWRGRHVFCSCYYFALASALASFIFHFSFFIFHFSLASSGAEPPSYLSAPSGLQTILLRLSLRPSLFHFSLFVFRFSFFTSLLNATHSHADIYTEAIVLFSPSASAPPCAALPPGCCRCP